MNELHLSKRLAEIHTEVPLDSENYLWIWLCHNIKSYSIYL